MIFETIKALCGSKGISICKLEKELNLANASISRWKRAYPSADRLKRVADYFGVSIDYLLGNKATSPQGQELANIYDSLPTPKQDLVKKYVEMMQDGT